MLKNKHVIAALIITPILAVLGYFAVDFLVTEKPHAAESGSAHQLIARSSCRYASGHCVLANGEFKLDLKAEYQTGGKLLLLMNSAFPLEGSKVALVDDASSAGMPVAMSVVDDSRQQWRVLLPSPAGENSTLRLVATANETIYFGESGIDFTHYETGFGDDFRRVNQ